MPRTRRPHALARRRNGPGPLRRRLPPREAAGPAAATRSVDRRRRPTGTTGRTRRARVLAGEVAMGAGYHGPHRSQVSHAASVAPTSAGGPAGQTGAVQTQGEIYLPAQMVTTGWGIPPVCVRHGRPATTTRKIRFASRTPWWAYLTLLAGLLVALIVILVVQKRVTAPAWPVCDECRRLRRSRLTAMWCLLVGGPVLGTLLAGAAGSSGPGGEANGLALIAGWLLAPLAGAIVGGAGAWAACSPQRRPDRSVRLVPATGTRVRPAAARDGPTACAAAAAPVVRSTVTGPTILPVASRTPREPGRRRQTSTTTGMIIGRRR